MCFVIWYCLCWSLPLSLSLPIPLSWTIIIRVTTIRSITIIVYYCLLLLLLLLSVPLLLLLLLLLLYFLVHHYRHYHCYHYYHNEGTSAHAVQSSILSNSMRKKMGRTCKQRPWESAFLFQSFASSFAWWVAWVSAIWIAIVEGTRHQAGQTRGC